MKLPDAQPHAPRQRVRHRRTQTVFTHARDGSDHEPRLWERQPELNALIMAGFGSSCPRESMDVGPLRAYSGPSLYACSCMRTRASHPLCGLPPRHSSAPQRRSRESHCVRTVTCPAPPRAPATPHRLSPSAPPTITSPRAPLPFCRLRLQRHLRGWDDGAHVNIFSQISCLSVCSLSNVDGAEVIISGSSNREN